MNQKHLATYLNDHLAGSVGALELLELLAAAYSGSDVEQFARGLHADISADRMELESLMAELQIKQSVSRKVSAWVAEKLTQLKLRIDDPAGKAMRLFEAVEAVAIGIEGKRCLSCALAAIAPRAPELPRRDFERLIRRSEEQRQRAEIVRIDAAKAALIGEP